MELLEESKKCFNENCFLATALICVTQIEGLIWDFASLLNNNNIYIYKEINNKYKKEYYPYKWLEDQDKYSKYSLDGKPDYSKNTRINSVCSLLNNTKLKKIIYQEIYTFLIDEAHNLVDRSREMFSAEIFKQPVLDVRRTIRKELPGAYKSLGKINSWMVRERKKCEEQNPELLNNGLLGYLLINGFIH